jgi:hypothetical protein
MQQVAHMFYATVFLLLGSSGKPIDWSETVPRFGEFISVCGRPRLTLRTTQSIHESHQNSLFRVVIALSHQHGAGMAHNLAGLEQERSRAVAKMVCFSSSAVACSSRLKSISQQFKL